VVQIYIEVDVAPLVLDPKALWVQDWYFCVALGGGQTNCSTIAIGHVPVLGPFTVSELLVYGLGIVLFGFFVLKADVMLFWKAIFMGNFKRITETALNSSFHESAHKSTVKSGNGKEDLRSGNGKEDDVTEKKQIEMAKAHPSARSSKGNVDEELGDN